MPHRAEPSDPPEATPSVTRRPARLRRSLRGPASWGILDQLISSSSNFAVVALAAKTSTVETFGAFAVAYIVYGFVVGVVRAVGGEILLLRAAEARGRVAREEARLLGVTLAIAGVAGASLVAASFAVEQPAVAAALRATGAVLPVVLVQDSLRYCFFAAGRAPLAVLNDSVWAVVAVSLFSVIYLADLSLGPDELILAWAAGAAVAMAIGLAQARLRPRVQGVRGWVTGDRERVASFFADFLLTTGAFFVAIQLVGVIAGIAAVAAMQGAQLLFAPFATVASGARIFILPALARALQEAVPELRRAVRRTSGVLYAAAAGWAAIVLAAPDSVGEGLLGATWGSAEPLLPFVGLYWVARTGALPALDGLRALGGGRPLVVVRAQSGVLILAAAVVGSATDGARGAAIGLAAALCTSVVLWWSGFARVTRDRVARTAASAVPDP